MRRAFATAGMVISAVSICAATAAAPNPIGVWTRQDGSSRIQIAPCGAHICAVNTWVRDPQGSEQVGDTLVMTLTPATSSVLEGEAYDQRRKMTYSMTMSFDGAGMRTNGCVAFGLLCKTAEWTRAQ